MTAMRVWLTTWEWDCCGDPFTAGDRVSFNVSREASPWLQEMLGPDLADSIAAVESHHDETGPEQLSGVVSAIHGVTLDHSERREPRPNQPPPPSMPIGKGVWASMGSRDPYVTIVEPIPGTARLHPAPHVPWPARDGSPDADPPAPRGLSGYLVDLDAD